MSVLWVLLVVAAAVAAYVVYAYNRFVTLRTRTDEAWSDIRVQMKRRYDLIPNLVETVKGYAAHEAGTLQAVVEARNRAMADSGSPEHQARSENILQGALRQLFALAEAYPDLKANQNFSQLQAELTDTENRINMSRRFYNGSVRDLNVMVEQFPSNLVARQFGFGKREFFELDESEATAASRPVPVSFQR
ncbi:LemA family protein [Lutibaculum baratangense]|uniref:LemA PROTEIN n=1 Tax=Lutibaculum baratangense AMV1 TaxID=631454 RepID=V4RRG5_9HYPH|nr:LemA family protein [Lutibaculum baratangense]ESR25735.1 LemA PROTEIN [Lutibaculum baratangense AMV1]